MSPCRVAPMTTAVRAIQRRTTTPNRAIRYPFDQRRPTMETARQTRPEESSGVPSSSGEISVRMSDFPRARLLDFRVASSPIRRRGRTPDLLRVRPIRHPRPFVPSSSTRLLHGTLNLWRNDRTDRTSAPRRRPFRARRPPSRALTTETGLTDFHGIRSPREKSIATKPTNSEIRAAPVEPADAHSEASIPPAMMATIRRWTTPGSGRDEYSPASGTDTHGTTIPNRWSAYSNQTRRRISPTT